MSPPITAEESIQDTSFRRGILNLREYVICEEFPKTENWISIVEEPEWLDKSIENLEKLKDLEPNWNSYDSVSIDHDLIFRAKTLLESVSISGIPEPFVAPVSSGGINFEWDMPLRYLSIKIRPEGVRFFCVKKDKNEEKEKGLVEDGLDSVLTLLK